MKANIHALVGTKLVIEIRRGSRLEVLEQDLRYKKRTSPQGYIEDCCYICITMNTRHLYTCLLMLAMPLAMICQERAATLPRIYIDTQGLAIGQDSRYPATLSIVSPSKADSVVLPPHPIGIKVRGKSAAQYPKKSYSIEFVDSARQETDISLLGMRNDDDWILDAMYVDHARMRNRLCTDIWNAYNRITHNTDEPKALNGTRGTFVEVILDGQYNGLYCLTERIDRKQLKLKKYKDTYRGVSYKAVTWDNLMGYCSYDPMAPTETLLWNGFEAEYPGTDSTAGWEYLKEFLELISAAHTSDETFYDEIHEHLHIDNLVDYTLLINAVYAPDNVAKNLYLSIYDVAHDRRFFFTPWDMDATFGRTYDGTLIHRYAFSESVPFGNQLISRLWDEDALQFKQLLAQRWSALRLTTLSPDSVAARIHAYQELFESSGAFAREQARWPELCADKLAEEVDFMTAWYARNVQVIDSVLAHTTATHPLADTSLPPGYTIQGDHLTVDTPHATVALYSLQGATLYSATCPTVHSIVLPHKGVYILCIAIDGEIYTYKIVHTGR